jgi:hypothetical protein
MVGRLDRRIKDYSEKYGRMRKENNTAYNNEPNEEEDNAVGYGEYERDQYDHPAPKRFENIIPDNTQLIPSEEGPLSILDEIRELPSPKGAYPTVIYGIPVDLHVLEDYIVKISPYNIRTAMRFHNARTIEEIKGYSKFGSMHKKFNWMIIVMIAIMAAAGIGVIIFMPQIMAGLQGFVP